MLPSKSLQVSFLLSTLPYMTFKDTNKPLIAAVIVWKYAPCRFDCPRDEHREVNCNYRLEFRRVYALALGEHSRSFFIFSKTFQTKKIKKLRPKMTKIASRGPALT